MADVQIPYGIQSKSLGYNVKTLLWGDIMIEENGNVTIPDGKTLNDVLLYILNYNQHNHGAVNEGQSGRWYARGVYNSSTGTFYCSTGCGSNESGFTYSKEMTVTYLPGTSVDSGWQAVLTVVFKK